MEAARPSNGRDAPRNADWVPYLICRSNACLCALPLGSVAETMRPLPVEPLAKVPPFVLGVSVIRGAPVPVVDTAKLLGASSAAAQRVVTLKIGERRVALAVDGVIGVRALPPSSLDEVPPLLRDAGEDTVAAIATLDDQLLLVLRSARIIPESVWQSLDAEAPRT